MLIAKRHPTMKRALHAEKGLVGSYAAAVLAVAGSVLSLGLFFGGSPTSADAPAEAPDHVPALISPETAQIWLDSDPQSHVNAAASSAAPTPKDFGFEDTPIEAGQPFYDEAAGVVISTR